MAEADDINALAPNYDVQDSITRKEPWPPSCVSSTPRAAFTRGGLRLRRDGQDFRARCDRPDRKNPDVKFDIYFPPYSILQFVAMRDASPATLKIAYDFAAYAFPR